MNNQVIVKFKKLNSEAKMPVKASKSAACFDIYAGVSETHGGTYFIAPQTWTFISTGIAMAIPEGYHAKVFSRSGHGTKEINLMNCVGIIDSDYRGELKILLRNNKHKDYFAIDPGERVAQIMIEKNVDTLFIEVPILDETDRGQGGFGSTGIKEIDK